MNILKFPLLQKISVVFLANLFSLIGGALITLILPKFIGVTHYAYYQLYIFYTSYIGLLGLGWLDGIYLRYGGKYYDKIDKKLLSSQWRIFSICEVIISIGIFIATILNYPGFEKEFVYMCCCCCIIIFLPRVFFNNLLLTVGRVKFFAYSLCIDKCLQIILSILGLIIGQNKFEWFIISELIGRMCGTLFIFYICKDIIFANTYPLKSITSEIRANIISGLALMISNVASMFIVGSVRQAIVMKWGIETFGKISLTLAISNLLLIFINSVAMVLFPMLKRLEREKLTSVYNNIRSILLMLVLSILFLYIPIKNIACLWLPKYVDSLKYMAILFPMIVFESKMALLINTYMSALRLERELLKVNLISVMISILLSVLFCKFYVNLNLIVLSIIFVIMFRSILAEVILKKNINISIYTNIFWEIMLTTVFIIGSFYFNELKGLIIYLCTYLIYVFFNKNNINFNSLRN